MTRDGRDLEGWELERWSFELAERGNRSRGGSEGRRDRNDVRNGEGEDPESRKREGDTAAAERKEAEAVSRNHTAVRTVWVDAPLPLSRRPPSKATLHERVTETRHAINGPNGLSFCNQGSKVRRGKGEKLPGLDSNQQPFG